jgi:hypothetical protein
VFEYGGDGSNKKDFMDKATIKIKEGRVTKLFEAQKL